MVNDKAFTGLNNRLKPTTIVEKAFFQTARTDRTAAPLANGLANVSRSRHPRPKRETR